MNTIEQVPPDLAPAVDLAQGSDVSAYTEPIINGFENGAKPLLKEPSLYLSIAIVFIATAVCFSKTPIFFWLSLGLMSALAVVFHIMAERFLFRSNKEHQVFAAPLEGIFVLTLGAIIPGVSLLSYGLYSLFTAQNANVAEEFAKLALLLAVPFFNFVVWSAVRKRYLVRPRLIGLMNGFAFGLSAAWSTIWAITVMFGHSNPSCKLGWMLLLCTAPFLLFAASCLGLDLWNKTEKNIRRVAATFSVLGLSLSLLFVLAPLARVSFMQSLINNARLASIEEQEAAAADLRSFATDEDLRPSKYPVGGFALAALLIPNRGLESGSDADTELYFKVTGKPFSTLGEKKGKPIEQEQISPVVGEKIPGLSLARSQITGNIDATTLSSSIDWTLILHNSSSTPQEGRCELALPKHAVLSRATVWFNGEAREGTFTSPATLRLDQAQQQNLEPLLVTMPTPGRILVQCYPLRASGGEMKVRLGFKLPLETSDRKTCSLKLPHLVATNFIQSKRQRLNLASTDLPLANLPGLLIEKNAGGYSLSGVIKTQTGKAGESLMVQRSDNPTTFATLDTSVSKTRYIVQNLKEISRPTVKRLYVVIDSSAALKSHAQELKEAVAAIPANLKPVVCFAGKSAQALINANAFSGGQDNWLTLRGTLETAAEQANSAVLWIHGPQPTAPKMADSAVLDLVHRVSLYDLQIEAGPNSILPALQTEDVSGLIAYEHLSADSSASSLQTVATIWNKDAATKDGATSLVVQRSLSLTKPPCVIISDPLASAQTTGLWAGAEVAKLLASGHQSGAQLMAINYHLVTPVTGAVVLQNDRDYRGRKRGSAAYQEALGRAASIVWGGGLVGAPVDPRYGQSNEVGQLADYGYDSLRDLCRLLTAIAFLISTTVGVIFVKGKKVKTWNVYAKATGTVLAATMVVHLIGTFMINNCGALGGGL